MAAAARRGALSIPVLQAARQLTQHLPQKDYRGEAESLFHFVRDNIRYVRDIDQQETVQEPDVTLRLKSGDCDDKATLLAALLKAVGHKALFRAVGFKPGVFSHVYVETLIGTVWVPLETTEPWEMGRAPSGVVVRMVQHV